MPPLAHKKGTYSRRRRTFVKHTIKSSGESRNLFREGRNIHITENSSTSLRSAHDTRIVGSNPGTDKSPGRRDFKWGMQITGQMGFLGFRLLIDTWLLSIVNPKPVHNPTTTEYSTRVFTFALQGLLKRYWFLQERLKRRCLIRKIIKLYTVLEVTAIRLTL